MAVEKVNSSSSLAEVVDRILDKGIVVDAWVRVSLVGIELLAIEAREVCRSCRFDCPSCSSRCIVRLAISIHSVWEELAVRQLSSQTFTFSNLLTVFHLFETEMLS